MTKNAGDTIRIDAKKVDRKVGEAFKSYVFKKHGKIRGVFSEEVTAALSEYLRRKGGFDTELRDPNIKATKTWMGICDQLYDEEKRLAKLEKEVFRPSDM